MNKSVYCSKCTKMIDQLSAMVHEHFKKPMNNPETVEERLGQIVNKIFNDGVMYQADKITHKVAYDSKQESIKEILALRDKQLIEKIEGLYTCIGPSDQIHRCSYGHCGRCGECDILASVLSLLEGGE